MKRRIIAEHIALLLALLLPAACAPKQAAPVPAETPAPVIALVSEHDGGVIRLNDEVITTYWETDFADSLAYLKDNCFKSTYEAHDGQDLQLRWSGGTAPYTVEYATDPDFQTAVSLTTERDRIRPGDLFPRTAYWYRVTDADGNASAVGSFISGDEPRIILARERVDSSGVKNVRDLGGYAAAGGKTVKYGMLYRGGMFLYPNGTANKTHRLTDYGRAVIGRWGLKTEIDLRDDTDFGGQTEAAFENCAYLRVTYRGYTSIFPSDTATDTVYYDERSPEAFRQIFSLLAEEQNYPVYFHCLIGQDRTGTLAYLILGLLGVDFEDITKDYELSAFSAVGSMNREKDWKYSGNGVPAGTHHVDRVWETMNTMMLHYYGAESGLLSDAVANYLLRECGITEEQIASVRNILLEN
ncbi:MAG: tyrosine-protein phosphatase [Clostridia bacterium]|nr:tyrosine-protein phosphatase [Clostridia bacterium]